MSLHPEDLPYRSRRPSPRDYPDYDDRPRRSPRDLDEGGRRRRPANPRRSLSYDADLSDYDPYPRRRPKTGRSRPHDDDPPITRPPIGRSPPSDDDFNAPPPPSSSRKSRPRDHEPRYDSLDPPRRRRRDHSHDPPSRSSRQKPPARHYHSDPSPSDSDSSHHRAPPPRRRRDEHRNQADDRGYRSDYYHAPRRDQPSRRAKDYHDRGYATEGRRGGGGYDKYDRPRASRYEDGKVSRRDRDRERYSNIPNYPDKDDRHKRNRDRDRDPRAAGAGNGGLAKYKDKIDMDKIGRYVETGQKHWKSVEPIAKPIALAVAKKYMGGAGGGGGGK